MKTQPGRGVSGWAGSSRAAWMVRPDGKPTAPSVGFSTPAAQARQVDQASGRRPASRVPRLVTRCDPLSDARRSAIGRCMSRPATTGFGIPDALRLGSTDASASCLGSTWSRGASPTSQSLVERPVGRGSSSLNCMLPDPPGRASPTFQSLLRRSVCHRSAPSGEMVTQA